MTTELADVITQMVANLQIAAPEESVKRLDSPPEPLSVCGLASCVTETSAKIFDIFSLSGKIKHRISWLRTQQNGMMILGTENLKQQCQK